MGVGGAEVPYKLINYVEAYRAFSYCIRMLAVDIIICFTNVWRVGLPGSAYEKLI